MTVAREYPGDVSGSSELRFPIEYWVNVQKDLAATDALFRILAQKHSFDFGGNIKGYWPARTLTERKIGRKKVFGFGLNEGAFERDERAYIFWQGTVNLLPGKDDMLDKKLHVSASNANDIEYLEELFAREIGLPVW